MNNNVDLTGAVWSKSSFSNGQSACVEVANGYRGVVPVRDSKATEGPALMPTTEAWSSFVSAVKGGQFDV
ncbi:DUF397 domain-containing protein [Streptomyces sp. H27-D2]|uniref:DUF397 domain-containing protein n=1 Tax=Streptomyces sp. H27-D2 TaxID=3046304 RepID=UPI002DB56355|nr:DUF397 domain-containing protein [Streptomyces sp. H27-D2]MEC4016218.1 DUF397 domain-containing protein [Streptomyces sp. H27-D2]